MIDIHSHILPAVDDGARTMEEAVAMVEMAAADGTTDIVATPHANDEFTYDVETVAAKIRELEEASGRRIRIHRGCDLHLSLSNIFDAIRNPAKYTIDGNGYLLVEFPDLMPPTGFEGALTRLRRSGITPIITHPERHGILQHRPEQAKRWIQAGCLVQVTAQSILGAFGKEAKRCSQQLLERNLVHVVASDCHDRQYRPPLLSEAYRVVAAEHGDHIGDALFRDHPAAVLAGAPIY